MGPHLQPHHLDCRYTLTLYDTGQRLVDVAESWTNEAGCRLLQEVQPRAAALAQAIDQTHLCQRSSWCAALQIVRVRMERSGDWCAGAHHLRPSPAKLGCPHVRLGVAWLVLRKDHVTRGVLGRVLPVVQ